MFSRLRSVVVKDSTLRPVGNVSHLFLQVKYQDKDVIVSEGAEANTFYIILKGEVILY